MLINDTVYSKLNALAPAEIARDYNSLLRWYTGNNSQLNDDQLALFAGAEFNDSALAFYKAVSSSNQLNAAKLDYFENL